MFRQCRLRRDVKSNGQKVTWFQVSFLPVKYAMKGKRLRLRNDNDVWEDGWVVDQVFSATVDKPVYAASAIREHRKRTGDSLPKVSHG